MLLAVRSRLRELGLVEPSHTHAHALMRRASVRLGLESQVDDSVAWVAALEYLARKIADPDIDVRTVASEHGVPDWRVMRVLGSVRDASDYRSYIGEWIREGSPDFSVAIEPEVGQAPEAEAEEIELPELALADEGDEGATEVIPLVSGPSPPAPRVQLALPPSDLELPARWRTGLAPYTWQEQAARAWEQNEGHGIMQVVTGAGKTALAIYLVGRMLDRVATSGEELQTVVVVPRIELARQWAREFRRLLDLRGLHLGEYHSGSRCAISRQDILIITQDSARSVIPRHYFDRPVLLVADECHRLGAPAASKVLAPDFTWTLGLSATPERAGDSGFEETLVPRLGPVVWKYGYREAVRDGIIARFSVARVKVDFTPEEAADYAERSERIKRLLDSLKSDYRGLRAASRGRFWQIMGDLKRRNPDDERFEILTAIASERRAIVHFAAQKYGGVDLLARELGRPRKVLCFHERIEATAPLAKICRKAGRTTAVYHSKLSQQERDENLDSFRRGGADWLIACKSLDEGLDIPAVDTVVIVAGTKSPRQLIQRLGRGLRRKGEDRAAAVVLVEVAGVDDAILDHEALEELTDAAEEVVELRLSELSAWLKGSVQAETELAAPDVAEHSIGAVKAIPRAEREATQPEKKVAAPPLPLPPAGEPRKKVDRVTLEKRFAEKMRNLKHDVTRLLGRRNWTGTGGNQSYYDKDSSPD